MSTCECSGVNADRICIEELEVFGHVGVTEAERAKPQRLTLNITVSLSTAFEDLNDDITHTVNYSAVSVEAREFTRANSYALVETLGASLAARLLERFAIKEIEIELRKFVLPDAKHVAVKLTRSAR